MRKRVVSVALAVALAVAPLGVGSTASAAPLSASDLQTLALRSAASSNDANANDVATVADDAAVNGWTIDRNTAKGGEILAAGTGDYAGWTHFKSTSANGNATSSSGYPAVAISGKTIDLTRAGEFSIKVKSPQAGSANRFGFYLGYKDPGNALFLGYDKGAGSGRSMSAAMAIGTTAHVSLPLPRTLKSPSTSPGLPPRLPR